MTPSRLPVRLVICVDGTWCSPDGPHGSRAENITNVYRIYASVKKGICRDAITGLEYKQRSHYEKGIGADDDLPWANRLHVGIHGNECLDQIRDLYQMCCELGPEDEVWFFGFSRGAYVVRAVAGLLHYLWCLSPPSQSNPKQKRLEEGAIHHLFTAKTHPPPKIGFVGVFDTVKAVRDDYLYDISFKYSIGHMRHAVGLNENRKHFQPETIYPNLSDRASGLVKRSIVQAWFIGAHMDMGGSNKEDGLALYPLQWMLIEAQKLGLCLEFAGNYGGRTGLTNPLRIVGLESRNDEDEEKAWSCTVKNGIVVTMHDMRSVHDPDGEHGTRYTIRTHQRKATGWPKRLHQPFGLEGDLIGYCEYAPQGTIIHPSVYLLRDEYSNGSLNLPMFGFTTGEHPVSRLRETMLGTTPVGRGLTGYVMPNMGFWNQNPSSLKDPGAIRVLVCGNCGVGKSTLINTVFGAEVTTTSDRERGRHDIRQELTNAQRPDLKVHDSGGFEAGTANQFHDVEGFLREKSAELDIDRRLHFIWFCIDALSDRTVQGATEKLFETVSEYAQDVPIIVVATKKDNFVGAKIKERSSLLKKEKKKFTYEELEQYAEEQVQYRVEEIKAELASVKGGRFDDCIAVDKDDEESIQRLTEITAESFTHDRVRLLYIRAQVTRIDLKISLALEETMTVYRRILKSALGVGAMPLASTSNRMAAAISICSAIINCFGLPRVTPEVLFQICKANLLDDLGNNFAVFFAEGLATVALGATILSGGMPFFLIPMVANIPAVVPATTRLFLMLACDLILVLTRAFQESVKRCVGQPLERDVERAAVAYRAYCGRVHDEVRRLVRRNVVDSFKTERIAAGIRDIVETHRKEMDSGEPAVFSAPRPRVYRHSLGSVSTLQASTSEGEELMDEGEEIKRGMEMAMKNSQSSRMVQ
ncbi:hypothetical protein QBC47DRAFT_458153, partial [Echria macrotheca]